jgi:hypothetical protein
LFKFGAIFCLLVLLVAIGSGYGIHLKLGSEALNAWGAYLSGCGALTLALAAIVAGFLAISDYRTRVLAEKSKWFLQLYEKLFEGGQFKEVRRKLDYGDTDEIKMLIDRDAQRFGVYRSSAGEIRRIHGLSKLLRVHRPPEGNRPTNVRRYQRHIQLLFDSSDQGAKS